MTKWVLDHSRSLLIAHAAHYTAPGACIQCVHSGGTGVPERVRPKPELVTEHGDVGFQGFTGLVHKYLG